MKLTVRETALFGFFGALMFASKIVMEAFPNIHLVGVFTVVFTIVYRIRALYPIYIYVVLLGLYGGFNAWWVPNLYIWLFLWGAVMLLPKNMPPKLSPVVYALVCGIFGLLFGTLYAPAQALMFGYSVNQTVAWIIAGLPFDALHAAGNFGLGFLSAPLIAVIKRLEK